MMDCRIFEDMSAGATSMEIRSNAHRDSRTTIARHLLHRERMGDQIHYAGHDGRAACIAAGTLWEISLDRKNGGQLHVAGPTLDVCLMTAMAALNASLLDAIAA